MKLQWPFAKGLETRSESSYTDALIAAIVSQQSGNDLAIVTATAAMEACVGLVGRSFAAADVQARPVLSEALTPDVLELIGRSMIRRGDLAFLIDTQGGALSLIPASTVNVSGQPHPSTWVYDLTCGGPSATMSYQGVPAASVLHFRYAADPERPWRGQGPIDVARLAGKLSAATVNALANEAAGPQGRILGVPKDGEDPTMSGLKQDIASARGRMLLMEAGDWAQGAGGQRAGIMSARFGAEPPDGLVNVAQQASIEIVAACGLHSGLWGLGDASAAVVREAWRLALFGLVAPLGKKVSAELTAKLGDTVTLDWQDLRASDLSGRARAFQSMVGGGMDVAKAAALAGLLTPEEVD